MLTPEQARSELDRLAIPDALARRQRKAGRLLGAAGKLGEEILSPHTTHRGPRPRMDPAQVGRAVDDLGAQRRAKLFTALHPTLGGLLAAGWDDLRGDPYTRGYERRAFRATQRPDLTAAHRLQWVRHVVSITAAYEQPVEWFAAWASHLPGNANPLGRLLAVAVDHGNADVFDTLVQTAQGQHPVAQLGRPVITALLTAARPDGWEQVERLLLAAQRAEGLRQVILESADLGHPDAFGRMLGLVTDHDLTRFAAVVRAAAVWLGEPFDVTDRRMLDGLLTGLATSLNESAARNAALAGADPGAVRLALWAQAYLDAPTAAQQAATLLGHPSADCRLAAILLLDATQLEDSVPALARALDDDDLRVAAVALQAVGRRSEAGDAVCAALRRLVGRLGRGVTVTVGTWKPSDITMTAAEAADAVTFHAGHHSPRELDDLLEHMSPMGRMRYARLLADDPQRHRDALLALLADRSESVRDSALRALGGVQPSPEEAQQLEALLTRKSSDLRRAVLELLSRQPDAALVASVQRLLDSSGNQRRAGEELLDQARKQGRATPELAARDLPVGAGAPAPAVPQPAAPVTAPPLVDERSRTPATQPQPPAQPVLRYADGVVRVLRSFDAWVAEHRDAEVRWDSWSGKTERLVGDLRRVPPPTVHQPWAEQRFPLPELVDPWWQRTAGQLTDGGLEVLLAGPAVEAASPPDRLGAYQPALPRWVLDLGRQSPARNVGDLSYAPVSVGLLRWLAVRELQPAWIDALLDGLQGALAAVPPKAVTSLPRVAQLLADRHRGVGQVDWRAAPGITAWWTAALLAEQIRPEQWTAQQRGRLWHLVRFLDEPGGTHIASPQDRETSDVGRAYGVAQDYPRRPARQRPPIGLAVRAVRDGAATEADVVELLVGERVPDDDNGQWHLRERNPLAELTRRRGHPLLRTEPWLAALVRRVRETIVATELQRGDLPTPMSGAALHLRSIEGATTVVRLLAGLGSDKLVRGYIWAGDARPSVFSKLIRGCFPADGDTPEQFAAAAREAGLKQPRLLELAVYAPQWAPFVEATVGWQGLTDAVHWLHAHTKDDQWQVDEDVREAWAVQTHQRTPLRPADLVDGAVDVAWFGRLRTTLGDDHFDALLTAARYASSSGGHKRAELFARALRGQVTAADLLTRMRDKRHQDSVRAYGLLPLPDRDEARQTAVLERYEELQSWRQGSSKFGQQRRASEALAVRIGLANLARTAGYRDPQRLRWAMEAEAVRDLASGPVTVTEGDVTVALSIDAGGAPTVDVRRGDRELKSVPKAVAKTEGIAALTARAARLRKQSARMRAALEEAAVRGDDFSSDELGAMLAHPLLAPLLDVTVVTTAEGVIGFPRRDMSALLGPDGEERPADGSSLRLAHPVDLLASGEWHAWQRACFARHLRQPFKQVFRELYVPTDAERADGRRSQRYAGQQVKPQQAAALLGARGWIVRREEGALRTFHDERITVVLDVLGGWSTPAEVEGMALESVVFLPADGGRPLPLVEVPPRLFSEVMRDLDLVVSVAHAGGVDPEASASTVEVRAALVRETAELLRLDNIELTDHHALITGQLGSYSVHLGSGTVHRRPGNAICIVPIGSQHRGRLFLPFVDDDPRTAEVVSKVVLLARDTEIKDPTVLEQLRV